jgi:hypothetical protein
VHPDFGDCLSGGRGLRLRASPEVSVSLELVVLSPGDHHLAIGWLADPGSFLDVAVQDLRVRVESRGGCQVSSIGSVSVRRTAEVRFESSSDLHLDYLELDRRESKKR